MKSSTTTVSELVKIVIASGDVVELEKLKAQLKTKTVDVLGDEVTLYDIYFGEWSQLFEKNN